MQAVGQGRVSLSIYKHRLTLIPSSACGITAALRARVEQLDGILSLTQSCVNESHRFLAWNKLYDAPW